VTRREPFWLYGHDQLLVEFKEEGQVFQADTYNLGEPTLWERIRGLSR
jgi:hypothetical protein